MCGWYMDIRNNDSMNYTCTAMVGQLSVAHSGAAK